MIASIFLAPFSGYLLLPDQAMAQAPPAFDGDENPRSNFWRAVREGNSGYTAVRGDEANVLIQNGGENWRQLKQPVAQYGGWFIGAVALACLLFLLLKGRLRLENGESGMTVERWTTFERTLHWVNATLFIILGVTGLSLAYGRVVLIPIIGKDVFAAYAGLAKVVHDYLGPVFGVVLTVLLLRWLWMNIPSMTDVRWFLKGGGMFTNEHVAAGKTNGGEKAWYWLLFFGGIAVVASGVVLDFPNLGATRGDMQLANLIHTGSALILVGAAVGHIFIGSIGSEGSLRAMTTGRVDVEWARQHHDLWYQELLDQGVKPQTDSEAQAARDKPDKEAHSAHTPHSA
ncbi:MAG TPA: formate dehydrogenase subunit gamma [Gammaproteobacteria bacterium]|nr:formate dehydrogenase subunit gamma [Gammaproteobacteria bacterium]